MDNYFRLVSCLLAITLLQAEEIWRPTSWKQCRTNQDCPNPDKTCCSITPSLGKRSVGNLNFPEFVHYCLPYKTAAAEWCSLNIQYNISAPNYFGLCPCGPGLRCTPTTELNPHSYPRDRYGKCQPVM